MDAEYDMQIFRPYRSPGQVILDKMERDTDAMTERYAQMMERHGKPIEAAGIRMDNTMRKIDKFWNPPKYTDEDRRAVRDEFEEWKRERDAEEERERERQHRAEVRERQEQKRREHEALARRLRQVEVRVDDVLDEADFSRNLTEKLFNVVPSTHKTSFSTVESVISNTYEYLKAGEDEFTSFVQSVVDTLASSKAGDALSIVDELVNRFDPVDRHPLERLGRKLIWLLGPVAAGVEVSTRVMEGHCVRTVEMHKKLVQEYKDKGYTEKAAEIAAIRDLDFEGDHDPALLGRMIEEANN